MLWKDKIQPKYKQMEMENEIILREWIHILKGDNFSKLCCLLSVKVTELAPHFPFGVDPHPFRVYTFLEGMQKSKKEVMKVVIH